MTAEEIDAIWEVPFDTPLTPAMAVREEADAAARELASDGYSFRAPGPAETMCREALDKLDSPNRHMGEGPVFYDGWGLVLACIAFASGRNDLTSPERKGGGVDGVSAAHDVLASWGLEPTACPGPGDVLAYQMEDGRVHVAILTDTTGPERQITHAYWGRHVVTSWEGPYWRAKLVSAWTLPVGATDWPVSAPSVSEVAA